MSEITEFDNPELQLAENEDCSEQDCENSSDCRSESENKRQALEKTKIVKQTWSIVEIYQKVRSEILVLSPDYQRNVIWNAAKRTSFIESLYMGILIPPIYVIESPNINILDSVKYEVVDGKQRLSTIFDFLSNNFSLTDKDLEYYQDWFGKKRFSQVEKEYPKQTNAMLSSVLDVYVITANSPQFTKYDIFARLNKGAEPLKVNEIRKAIYQSDVVKQIGEFISKHMQDEAYKEIFSTNDIKRFEDYGKFFSSIAFYVRFNEVLDIIENYNSRPRDMINDVLSDIQKKEIILTSDVVGDVIDKTMLLLKRLKYHPHKLHLVNSCIWFAVKDFEKLQSVMEDIITDDLIMNTLSGKSPATTSNVNSRIKRIHEIFKGC